MPEARARARGTVRVRDQFVMAKYGKPARESFRKAALRELVAVLTTPGDVSTDFGLFIESTSLVCELFGTGTRTSRARSARSARRRTWARGAALVYRLLSPRMVMELAGGLLSHHYDGGRPSTSLEGSTVCASASRTSLAPTRCTLPLRGGRSGPSSSAQPRRVSVTKVKCRLEGHPARGGSSEWE
ncbi:MAG: hypothetical protein U0414_15365 [Polyangiaceae bacterium]